MNLNLIFRKGTNGNFCVGQNILLRFIDLFKEICDILFITKHNYIPAQTLPLSSQVPEIMNQPFICVIATMSDFQSGRPGSSPNLGHYSMRLNLGTGLNRTFIIPG